MADPDPESYLIGKDFSSDWDKNGSVYQHLSNGEKTEGFRFNFEEGLSNFSRLSYYEGESGASNVYHVGCVDQVKRDEVFDEDYSCTSLDGGSCQVKSGKVMGSALTNLELSCDSEENRGEGSDSGLGPDLACPELSTQQDSISSDELPSASNQLRALDHISAMAPQIWSGPPLTARPTKSTLKRPIPEDSSDSPRPKKCKRSIVFGDVRVYYFPRSQGFTCVPSQGGSTLGMIQKHIETRTLSVSEHATELRRVHRNMLAGSSSSSIPSSPSSSDSDTDDLENQDLDLEPDSCFFLQPVPTRQRRQMLRAAGVHKIDSTEKDECRDIRSSRELCGCSCKGYCDPDSCSCSQAGIKCQVDRLNFPCGCTHDGCANSNGRLEFDPMRVRTHFIHTMMRLEMEKKQEEEAMRRSMDSSHGSTSLHVNSMVGQPQGMGHNGMVHNPGYTNYHYPPATDAQYHYPGYHHDRFIYPSEPYSGYIDTQTYPAQDDYYRHYTQESLKVDHDPTFSYQAPEDPPPLPAPPSPHSDNSSDNFGEIIKKTMVESVTA